MREVQPEIGVYKRLMAACSRILVAVHMAVMVAKILRIRKIITIIMIQNGGPHTSTAATTTTTTGRTKNKDNDNHTRTITPGLKRNMHYESELQPQWQKQINHNDDSDI